MERPTMKTQRTYSRAEWLAVLCSIVLVGLAQSERLRRGQTSGGPKLESTDMDSNLYYHPTDPHWVDEHLLKMRAVGKEKA